MTQTAPIVALQPPKEVPLADIQAELNQIWSNYLASTDGDAPAATRAATFSLLVYEPAETQKLLSQLGYYSGPIDGIFGPRMETALHAAQRDFSLPLSAYATPELLDKLKQAIATQSAQGGLQPTLYSQDSAGSGLADAIASQSPCRVISLFPHTDDDSTVTAQVSAYCPVQKQQRSNLICCEYVSISGTNQEVAKLSTLIQSLLIPDLPRFMWWKSLPAPEEELFNKLAPHCNAVVFDSSSFSEVLVGLKVIAGLVRNGIQVFDLNWKRLAAWQELTAEAFDPPERRSALLEVDRVTLDYEKGNPAQAFLFMGWLASRLMWKPIKVLREQDQYDIHRIYFVDPNQREIIAELAALPVGEPGEIAGDLIDLKLASTNLEADCCTVLCSQTTGCMRMEAGGGAQSCRVQQVTPLQDQKPEILLSQQLQRWGADKLFEESLALTEQILGLL
jgi:glucose-6-phosphate dehydrogenase assembly protein OpcA